MTLHDLANYMENLGVPVTRATLSNYENGHVEPSPAMLKKLAMALGTTTDFLLSEPCAPLQLHFFKQLDVSASEKREIEAYVTDYLEKRLTVDRLLEIKTGWKKPAQVSFGPANTLEVCRYAEEVRRSWGLSQYPVSSVCHVLEAQGWDLFEFSSGFKMSGISGYDENSSIPFLYYTIIANVVHLRMRILQEVSYAYCQAEKNCDPEAIAETFASTILFTKEQALYEFGAHRTSISAEELTQVKLKYGLPKPQIMKRLQQLGIISMDLLQIYISHIRQRGYPSVRDAMTDPLLFYENPTSYRQKVHKAYSEGLLSNTDLNNYQMAVGVYNFDK